MRATIDTHNRRSSHDWDPIVYRETGASLPTRQPVSATVVPGWQTVPRPTR